MDENNVKLQFFWRSKEQLKRAKGKTWSRDTNSCLPFAVTMTRNLYNNKIETSAHGLQANAYPKKL